MINRRQFIAGGLLGVASLPLLASYRKSIIGAHLTSAIEEAGEGLPKGFVQNTAMEVIANGGNFKPIDSGILCPQTGSFWVECDWVMTKQSSNAYIRPCGLWTVEGNTIGLSMSNWYNGRVINMQYGLYGNKEFTRTSAIKFHEFPFRCGFGMLDGYDVISIGDETWQQEPIGGERGTGTSTFVFCGCGNTWDNIVGTLVGPSRIFLDGEVVWDGIPCTRLSDGVPGFFDLCKRKFHASTKGIAAYDLPEE